MFNKKAYDHQWYLSHREEVNEKSRHRHLAHKDEERVRQHQSYLNHKDEIKQRQEQYLPAHKDEIRERGRQWRLTHPEEVREHNQRYRQTLKGKAKSQRKHTTHRTRLSKVINTLTANEWEAILAQHDFRCAYCGCSLLDLFNPPTRDHVMPISKGGDNTKENVVPACRSCNSRKYNHLIKTK